VLSDLDGDVDLDPGDGTTEYIGSGMALTSFNTGGEFQWADIWESSGLLQLIPFAVNTDTNGNIVVAGAYAEYIDFDPGAGEDFHDDQTYRSSFLLKLDMSGAFDWAKTWGPDSSDDFSESWGICADNNNNIYTCGYYKGSIDLDPGPGKDQYSTTEWSDAYLSKFLPDGSW
jgi:hypothetical protein